jgi:hypothetical protein
MQFAMQQSTLYNVCSVFCSSSVTPVALQEVKIIVARGCGGMDLLQNGKVVKSKLSMALFPAFSSGSFAKLSLLSRSSFEMKTLS